MIPSVLVPGCFRAFSGQRACSNLSMPAQHKTPAISKVNANGLFLAACHYHEPPSFLPAVPLPRLPPLPPLIPRPSLSYTPLDACTCSLGGQPLPIEALSIYLASLVRIQNGQLPLLPGYDGLNVSLFSVLSPQNCMCGGQVCAVSGNGPHCIDSTVLGG